MAIPAHSVPWMHPTTKTRTRAGQSTRIATIGRACVERPIWNGTATRTGTAAIASLAITVNVGSSQATSSAPQRWYDEFGYSLRRKRCPCGEDDVRLPGVALVAVAGVVLVAGCGSGSKETAPTTSATPTTLSPSKRSTKPKTARPSKTSTATSSRGPVLAWIRRLQRDLTTLRFYAGPITGIETAATKTAVIRFQRAAHLKPDGLWGPRSQAALDKMLHRKPSKPPPALGWIRNLQRDLTKLHLYSGPITGVETPATKTAVIRFQRAAHLKPDGLWGARSQAALDRMLHRH
jgi:peptidoglycan hydrolase-like protein with peptidoglycan-binding domain